MLRLSAAAFILGAFSGTLVGAVPAPGPYDGTLADNYVAKGWKYLGCANELSGSTRALNSGGFSSSTYTTIEVCMDYCQQRNFPYAGLENGVACWCADGYGLTSGSAVGQTGCATQCIADSKEICGGPNRISVFHDETYNALRSPAKIGTYAHVGCYREPLDGSHALPALLIDRTDMTINQCVNRCYTAGYMFAGVEYGRECWCDNRIHDGVIDASDPSGTYTCSMPCMGDAGQPCGNSNVVDIYKDTYQ